MSLETFSSIVKKFSLREDCVQCKSKEATRIAVSQLEEAEIMFTVAPQM